MKTAKNKTDISADVMHFVKNDFSPDFNKKEHAFHSNFLWSRLRETGTELWLDTGNIRDIERLWTKEFSAVTINNTLLNKEVQTGSYDSLVSDALGVLGRYPDLDRRQTVLELAFILNARHGLKLVENFDAFVSVEEHTDLAHDVEQAVLYGRRFYQVCPERFLIKVPFTPAGLLATRRLSAEGVPVNHTLGFSARQNYLITRISRPAYVNVFLGRLNSFVADNQLGDGSYIGEKATLASQRAVTRLRSGQQIKTRQIGASLRSGQQVRDLAGIDVMTMPPRAAEEFLSLEINADTVMDRTSEEYVPGLHEDTDAGGARLDTLWDIDDKLVTCVDMLEKENLDEFTPGDLVNFLSDHGCGDILVNWSESQIEKSAREGKIPVLSNWKDELASGDIGLDTLMNLAGLNSFTADQTSMDERVMGIVERGS